MSEFKAVVTPLDPETKLTRKNFSVEEQKLFYHELIKVLVCLCFRIVTECNIGK